MWVLYSRSRALPDIQVGDRILWNGETLEVHGKPHIWLSATASGTHHMEATLHQVPVTVEASSGVEAVLREVVTGAAGQRRIFTP
jgi:hypothetical protein